MLNDAAMLPRLTALLALALGLLRIAALSLHPDKLIADAPFSLADEVEYDARSIDLRSPWRMAATGTNWPRDSRPEQPAIPIGPCVTAKRDTGNPTCETQVGRDSE